jgi:hypothetical protein
VARVERESFAPLVNFSSRRREIRLDSSLRIRKLTKEERDDIEREMDDADAFRYHVEREKILSATHSVSLRQLVPFERDEAQKVRTKIATLCIILRLFKEGNIGVPFAEFEIDRSRGYGASGVSRLTTEVLLLPNFTSTSLRKKYELDDYDSKRFREFWTRFSPVLDKDSLDRRTHVELAVGRFAMTNYRESVTDHIVDTIVGLEALFVPENDELPYRLANRACMVLGNSDREREYVRQLIKTGYKVRSKIVHAGKVPASLKIAERETTLVELSDKLERILAKSIIASCVLSEKFAREKLVEILDGSLVLDKDRADVQSALRKDRKYLTIEGCPPL